MNSRIRIWLFALAAVAALVFLSLWLFAPSPARVYMAPPPTAANFDYEAMAQSYDWETSRQNLYFIGKALKVYRRKHTPKPVAERRTAADAGLPPNLMEDLGLAGAVWITPGTRQFPKDGLIPPFGHGWLRTTYGFATEGVVDPGAGNRTIWQKFGERVVVLVDWNAYTAESLAPAQAVGRKLRCLVLRLDGTVGDMSALPFYVEERKRSQDKSQ